MNNKNIMLILLVAIGLLFISLYINKVEIRQLTEENEQNRDDIEILTIEKIQLYEEIKQLERENRDLKLKLKEEATRSAQRKMPPPQPKEEVKPVKSSKDLGQFEITAYIDDAASQGKWVGQTATGYSLKGKSRTDAMCVAVDPKVIPLNSKVKLTFEGEMSKYNGVYTAYDTGGAIKGRIIDLFMGQSGSRQEMKNFGRRKVKVEIVE